MEETIIIAVLASTGLWKVVELIISTISQRIAAKRGKTGEIKALSDKLDKFIEHSNNEDKKQEKDSLRTQMLILMNHYPSDTQQLLTMAERYFVELKGDWYFTSLFKNHCTKCNIPVPDWWKEGKQ